MKRTILSLERECVSRIARHCEALRGKRGKRGKFVAFLPALLIVLPAYAGHDYRTDLLCRITDGTGQVNNYAFANNSENADGSFGGTFVETGYSNSKRQAVQAPAGSRPIWTYGGLSDGTLVISSRADPNWHIVVHGEPVQKGAFLHGKALLIYRSTNGKLTGVGSGSCIRANLPTGADVPDAGRE